MNMAIKSAMGLLLFVTSGASLASDTLVESLQSCRNVSDIAKRAACYDKLVDAATAQANANAVPRDPVRDFGSRDVPVPKAVRAEEPDAITTTVKTVSTNSKGGWVIVTETDAIWSQSDSEMPPRSPRVGQTIELKRAAMGSYMAKVDGGRAFRVKRVR